MQNHFELFQLPARFDIDQDALDSAYREIQGRVHPDRFVSASDAEHLKAAFNIKTVRDLGTNKHFLWAQAIAKLAD